MKIKGIIHCHSTYSYDGKESLVNLKQFLIERGIRFCALTEHTDFLTKESAAEMVLEAKALSDENFVFIPGFEVPYKDAHILMIGSEEFLGQKSDRELLKEWSKKSRLTVLAHPVRNKFEVDEVMLEAIQGIEVWNQQYEGKIVPRPKSLKLLQALKYKKLELLATGGTDFHRQEHFGAPIYELEVDRLTAEEILSKLTTGKYKFGNDEVMISSEGLLLNKISNLAFKSTLSVFVINSGKFTNKVLAVFGLKFPKALKQLVRRKV